MKKLDHKGFTLVEIIVTLGIVGIVISMIASFLFVNLRSFKDSHEEISIQSEKQFVMSFIEKEAMESVSSEFNTNTLILKSPDPNNPKNSIEHTFKCKDHKLFYKNNTTSTEFSQIGQYIESIFIEPIFIRDIQNGIKVTIYFKKGNKEDKATNQFWFRNSKEIKGQDTDEKK
ncbi:PilW family protein [Inediibacterium massiliense]|uniref:PilW family protein n=1 Tax=Inediibacterium massiliense TaxID=1658111 RepID=UPI0006B55C53|nr:type II secretion system protein [Inediibacterium massiliense]